MDLREPPDEIIHTEIENRKRNSQRSMKHLEILLYNFTFIFLTEEIGNYLKDSGNHLVVESKKEY